MAAHHVQTDPALPEWGAKQQRRLATDLGQQLLGAPQLAVEITWRRQVGPAAELRGKRPMGVAMIADLVSCFIDRPADAGVPFDLHASLEEGGANALGA